MSDDKPGIYECEVCHAKVYYPDTHDRKCPHYGTRRGKP